MQRGDGAAVCRTMLAIPSPSSPATVRYIAPPMTARATPGSLNDTSRCLPARMCCETRKAITRAGERDHERDRGEHHRLAARTIRRSGTAANVERMVPEENSALISRTPRTPMMSWASAAAGEAAGDRVEGGTVGCGRGVPAVDRGGADDDADAEHGDEGGEQRGAIGAQRAELRPLAPAEPRKRSIGAGSGCGCVQ